MSGFKESVDADLRGVFLNDSEFADKRTIVYDGETYTDIPIVMTGLKEEERHRLTNDHAQGLYHVTAIVHCSIHDLNGVQPERGSKIEINDTEGGGGFFQQFYVAKSDCELGMLRLELGAIGE